MHKSLPTYFFIIPYKDKNLFEMFKNNLYNKVISLFLFLNYILQTTDVYNKDYWQVFVSVAVIGIGCYPAVMPGQVHGQDAQI